MDVILGTYVLTLGNMVQLSHPYKTTGKIIALTTWTFVGKVMSLFFNILSRMVIAFLPWGLGAPPLKGKGDQKLKTESGGGCRKDFRGGQRRFPSFFFFFF